MVNNKPLQDARHPGPQAWVLHETQNAGRSLQSHVILLKPAFNKLWKQGQVLLGLIFFHL